MGVNLITMVTSDESRQLAAAVDKAFAVIQFTPAGTILSCNQNFSDLMGYGIAEIEGKHHSIFVSEQVAASEEYQCFWERLQQGEFIEAQYKRLRKDGSHVWLQASYVPIANEEGETEIVIKIATDITARRNVDLDAEARIAAIDRAMAVIEFTPEGKILTANKNFLDVMGYELSEIQGKHHRIFVTEDERESEDYSRFWPSLAEGSIYRGVFERVTKSGESVDLEATYQRVVDEAGVVQKVVKFAYDVSAQKQRITAQLDEQAQRLQEALDAANQAAAKREEMDQVLAEVSTPVTPIWDGLLLLPVVGIVDSRRSQDILQAVLTKIEAMKSREFIIDISGVPIVDTAIANHLISITRATALMGCHSTISGISPAIAQTIVSLGIDVGTVRTTATMMDAITGAFERLGLQVGARSDTPNAASAGRERREPAAGVY